VAQGNLGERSGQTPLTRLSRSLFQGYASVPLARKLERRPVGGGDGKAGIGNGGFDIEEKGGNAGAVSRKRVRGDGVTAPRKRRV